MDEPVGDAVGVEGPGGVQSGDDRLGEDLQAGRVAVLGGGQAQDEAVAALPAAYEELHARDESAGVGFGDGARDVLPVERDGADAYAFLGAAQDAEGAALGVGPLGAVAGGVADDGHEAAEELGDDDPSGPSCLADRFAGRLVQDLHDGLRGERPVDARVRTGDRPAEEAAVDARVSEGAGYGVGERAREEAALVVEEGFAPEEEEFHVRELAPDGDQVLGESAQRGRRSGDDVRAEVVEGGDGRLQRRRAADGQPYVGDGGVRERVEDEEEAGVELAGVEQVGHPVTGPQARVDEAGAECGDELLPFLTGVAGEARSPRGAAGLEHDGLPERGGQDEVVAQGVGGPELVLIHHGHIGEAVHPGRQVCVEVCVEGRAVSGETHEV